jgi:ABC-type multidrug transport system ATPase subunit
VRRRSRPARCELSAGQRQRIGLARALYGDPFLLVLDEANSNLDTAGDAALANAIAGMRARGGIVIMITHRPATLGPATHLAVISAGRLADFGARDEVLQRLQANSAPGQVADGPRPWRSHSGRSHSGRSHSGRSHSGQGSRRMNRPTTMTDPARQLLPVFAEDGAQKAQTPVLLARLLDAIGGLLIVLFRVAALIPMGGAVIGGGAVGVESRVKRIAHPTGGVIKAIYVRNGEHVTQGSC